MGRTNPTYRNFLESEEERWQPFRRGLRRRHERDFDRLFEYAARHAASAGYLNRTDPETSMLFSMLLAVETERRQLEERADALEEYTEALEDRADALDERVAALESQARGPDGC